MAKQTVCSISGKQYTDLSFSEISNGQFVCGDCGERLLIPEGTKLKGAVTVVVPKHMVPMATAAFRETIERASKNETRRAK
jgi:hypothetical protein